MILMIDNYDSFVYNLIRYSRELGAEIEVARNDAITISQIKNLAPSHIIISPGPCSPDQAGISLEVIHHFAGHIPLLGVCLGHQAIGQAFGGKVVRALKPIHGKVHKIHHNGAGLFAGAPQPLSVTRYHSLIVDQVSLPICLEITATTDEGEIMALRHRELPIAGVQFHPEAVLTEFGHGLLKNFFEGNL
ncbi:MAG: aminodeoxychorismate/anthranilate synthase component II [Candidatus Paracaedibacteraceae bacterium]|nr:aminodeoxychorismate/anthranilate synthase component II [Candidatus Paracaedibacteraceae bacterium]